MTNKNVLTNALFESDNLTALEALDRAQFIAFAPYVWEASKILRDKGILNIIENTREGISVDDIAAKINMSRYGIRVLLEAGLGIGLVYRKDNLFFLAKTGHFLLNHEMTKVNFDFMRDVCVQGSVTMQTSIETGKPTGLNTIGNWETLYQGLSSFPSPAKESWLAFDHFYSDKAFPKALKIIFDNPPEKMLDIGGNTGRWTIECLNYNQEIKMGIVDLPGQLAMAEENMKGAGLQDRVSYHAINMLDDTTSLPRGYDAIWMSQFLDCFSDNEIISILRKCHDVSDENTRIFINETFWDRQRFTTSAFSLQMTSLYFTNIANGNSQMYDSKVFLDLITEAGFKIIKEHDMVGLSHTILELKKA